MIIMCIDVEVCWLDVVIYNQILYYIGVLVNFDVDVFEQIVNILVQIDVVLEKQGSDKLCIFDVIIFFVDKSDFVVMNKVWDVWVVVGYVLVCCMVEVMLMNLQYKVEIKIIVVV